MFGCQLSEARPLTGAKFLEDQVWFDYARRIYQKLAYSKELLHQEFLTGRLFPAVS